MSERTTPSAVVVPVVANTPHALPSYSTEDSAGLDLRAKLDAPVVLQPGERALIPTGLHFALPQGYEAQVRPRSGLALAEILALVVLASFRSSFALLRHPPWVADPLLHKEGLLLVVPLNSGWVPMPQYQE